VSINVREIWLLKAAGYTDTKIAAVARITKQFLGLVKFGRRPMPEAMRAALRRELESLGLR
jgi:hypothetical protein